MGTVRGRTLWAERTASLQMSLGRKQLAHVWDWKKTIWLKIVSEKVYYGKKLG